MFQAARKHIGAIVMIGVASALVVGGVAAAQSESQSGSPRGRPAAGPPPIGGPPMKGLTYAEIPRPKERAGAGAADSTRARSPRSQSSSITLTENDGSSVTIPSTKTPRSSPDPVRARRSATYPKVRPWSFAGHEGGPAKSVMVPPKPGQMKGAPPGRRPASAAHPRAAKCSTASWEAGRPIRSPRPVVAGTASERLGA